MKEQGVMHQAMFGTGSTIMAQILTEFPYCL
jgi:hypothetical protein